MKTDPNDPIQPVTLRQVGDNDFRIASEKDIQHGLYLSRKMGMSKREELSSRAMQGILSADDTQVITVAEAAEFIGIPKDEYHFATHYPIYVAKKAVQHADALINELNKTQEGK